MASRAPDTRGSVAHYVDYSLVLLPNSSPRLILKNSLAREIN
jgi:hypothetical protein